MGTNFSHLRACDDQLFRLGSLAERYFPDDPNTTLLKLRQLGELLAQHVASRFGVEPGLEETQQQLVRRLECEGFLEHDVAELFHVVRRKGNLANHDLKGDHATALKTLRIAWQLGVWFHRTFTDPHFLSGPFQSPPLPPAAAAELEAQLRQAMEEQGEWEQLAAVEAKRANTDLAGLLSQLATKSGIWFRDRRRPTNLATPLDGWCTPLELRQLAQQDRERSDAELWPQSFSLGFPWRPDQR